MKNKRGYILIIIILNIMILFMVSFVLATSIWTSDVFGNSKDDFSPEDIVFINGKGFFKNVVVQTQITRPDSSVDEIFSITNSSGYFNGIYQLDGIVGLYKVKSNDGNNQAMTTFTDDAIWTTNGDCGDSNQDVNQFNINGSVFINGDGFSSGNYNWDITGKPGGASCDPGLVVSSGIFTVNISGAFCFNAYNISNDDCGEYQVKFDVKGDNYRVIGKSCIRDFDCGNKTSQLVCIENNIINETIIPDCRNDDKICIYDNSSQFVKSCDSSSSQIICSGNNLINISTNAGCLNGGCFNITQIPILIKDCGKSSSQLVCVGNDIINKSNSAGCGNASCFNMTNPDKFVKSCGNQSSKLICIGKDIVNRTIIPGCENASCFNTTIDKIIKTCAEKCSNALCVCIKDSDKDGVCDSVDKCPKTPPGAEVDKWGCSHIQFCAKQPICGDGCDLADWKNNEPFVNPYDCITVIVDKEGVLSPKCAALDGKTCGN